MIMFIFLLQDFVDCVDFSDVDSKYRNTSGQKAYPTAMLVRIILMGALYFIHSS